MSTKYISTHTGAQVDNAVDMVATNTANIAINTADIGSNTTRIKALEDKYAEDEGKSLTISASGGSLWYGETKNITISCTTNKTADTIEILNASGTVVATATSKTSLSYTVASANAAATYTCKATLNGVTKTTTASISVVYPAYIGGGSVYTDITSGTTYRTSSVTGTHSVTISTEGNYIFIVTPNSVSSVKYNGFELPMTTSTITMNAKTYYVYQSNAMQTGTYNLTIS